jgi:hypothetical protein
MRAAGQAERQSRSVSLPAGITGPADSGRVTAWVLVRLGAHLLAESARQDGSGEDARRT